MSAYQKVYMNQIHSSSLLCQLAHMWKSNLLCDAIIRTGPVITKAHRVVLVAACPMLQSMENASAGSHLEVRLAADIKQDSVNTFLQYLYEGFMMLTEENVREVEKIGRLLQVDSVTKCCVDFYKCLQGKTGAPVPGSSYKFSVNDTVEFRHVRATELQKTVQDRMMKRTTDFSRPGSPGNKRQRLQRNGSPDLSSFSGDKADDTVSMTNSYLAPDPWERVPRLGAGGNKSNKAPGVINMVEESIELVQTEPSEKETLNSQTHKTSVSLSVASQYNTEPNVSVVNVHQERDLPLTNSTPSHSARGSITVSPLTIFSENNNSENALSEQMRHESEVVFPERIKVTSTPRSSSHQNKPFAAGSANQASPGMIPKHMPRPPAMTSSRMESASPMDGEHRSSGANSQAEESPEDTSPDLSIVKVEKAEDIGLDMHIDVHDTGSMHLHKNRIMHSHDGDEGPDPSEQEMEDWAREEMSNEGSNVSGDQSNSWYMGTFKDGVLSTLPHVKKEECTVQNEPSFSDMQRSESKPANPVRDTMGFELGFPGQEVFLTQVPVPVPQSWDQSLSSVQNKGKSTVTCICNWCSVALGSKKELDDHIRISHSDKVNTFICQICHTSCDSKEDLTSHLLSMHKNNYKFFCFECGKGFKSQSGKDAHMGSRHGENSQCFTCHICQKSFSRPINLRNHMVSHSNVRQYVCERCGNKYKHLRDLKFHASACKVNQRMESNYYF